MPSKRSFLFTPILVIVGRCAGALVPLVIAHFYGVSPATDSFFFVLGAILLALETVSHLMESVIVPDLIALKKEPRKMSVFGNSILMASLAVSIALFALFLAGGLFLPEQWIGPGAGFANRTLRLFLEMSPFFFLAACACLANGFFYVHKIFWFPALSPVIRSGAVVGAIFVSHEELGIHAVTAGFVFGELVRTGLSFVLLAFLTPWRPVMNDCDGHKPVRELRHFMEHAGFQILAILAFNLFLVTDQWFASRLGAGQLSLLSYSDRLFLIPYQLFGAGLLHILHSDWSDTFHEEPAYVFWKRIQKDLGRVFTGAFLFSLAAWFFSRPSVALAYGHGHMREEDLRTIAGLFGWQMIGFVPAVMNLSYSRLFFILKKSRFYLVYSWSRFLLKVVLNILFMGFYGLNGIVISTVMVNLTAAAGLHFFLKRFFHEHSTRVSDGKH